MYVRFVHAHLNNTINMYRIKERKYSSNIIEKLIGKKWVVFIIPVCDKRNGDAECERLIKFYKTK